MKLKEFESLVFDHGGIKKNKRNRIPVKMIVCTRRWWITETIFGIVFFYIKVLVGSRIDACWFPKTIKVFIFQPAVLTSFKTYVFNVFPQYTFPCFVATIWFQYDIMTMDCSQQKRQLFEITLIFEHICFKINLKVPTIVQNNR